MKKSNEPIDAKIRAADSMEEALERMGKPAPEEIGLTEPPLILKTITPLEVKKLKKPIKLMYKFDGHCPQCGNTVQTLELESKLVGGKNKQLVVAWCLICNTKLEEKLVSKL